MSRAILVVIESAGVTEFAVGRTADGARVTVRQPAVGARLEVQAPALRARARAQR